MGRAPGRRRELRVLICGGGIAGEALAFWLARGGHQVVVAERFPALRATGAQVDLRGQGIEVIERMGLLDAVRSTLVDEAGVAFVDRRGRRRATFMANTSGRGRQGLTSEYEIMRGDLVRLLHEAVEGDVEHRFGVDVERFDQDEDGVVAHFSDGSSDGFDLLLGADGQGSRIRRALAPVGAPEEYRRLGMHTAYWFVPRIASDDTIRDTYVAERGRQIMRRSHAPSQSQAYFVLRETSAEASEVHRRPVEEQKEFWAERFRDAGWQAERFIDGLRSTPSFYSQEVVQVVADTWSRGRVGLVGDAAHCASPYSGMGVSAALVGAYVLADELHRHPDDPVTALRNYEATLRPFVDRVQSTVKPRLLAIGTPGTRAGVETLLAVAGLAGALRVPDLVARLASHDRGGAWQLPESSLLHRDPAGGAARPETRAGT